MKHFSDKNQLHQHIFSGAAVITSNSRLTRHIRQQYESAMLASGKSAWATPLIHSLEAWLSDQMHLAEKKTLEPFQSELVWKQVISGDIQSRGVFLSPQSILPAVMQASLLMSQYGIDEHDSAFVTDEEHLFLRWRSLFMKRCAEMDVIPSENRLKFLSQCIGDGMITIPQAVIWSGFDDYPPSLLNLQDIISRGNVTQWEWRSPEIRAAIELAPASDMVDEVRRAARWCRRELEAGKKTIGVVVDHLEEYHDMIERIFARELVPESALIEKTSDVPFNISLGKSIESFEMIRTAFFLLEWNPEEITFSQISHWLRSPFCGNHGDSYWRAGLEVMLRQRAGYCMTWKQWLTAIDAYGAANGRRESAARLTSSLAQLAEIYARRPMKGSFAQMLFYWETIWKAFRWPGNRTLDSFDYQIQQSWNRLQDAFVALASVCDSVSHDEALRILRRLAKNHIFQPKRPLVPIHVMGVLESVGHEFESLRVMGLDERHFPPQAAPNPFLPFSLMKRLNMPRSTPEREYIYAVNLLERLCQSAPHVVLSYPTRSADEEIQPSRLILNASCQGEEMGEESAAIQNRWLQADVNLESLNDDVPVVASMESLTGGVGILNAQTTCPFQAMAHFRLNAKALELPDVGVGPRERGTLLHLVMERFWGEVQTRTQLERLSLKEKRDVLGRLIESVWIEKKSLHQGPDHFQKKIFPIEKERTLSLLLDWLECELGRLDFEVLSTEEKQSGYVGQLPLLVKVDRIDQLSDGKLAVIDYKSGQTSVGDCRGERLKDTQLATYAILNSNQLAAVGYAKLNRKKMNWQFVRDPDVELLQIKGREKKAILWKEQMERWKRQLEGLADDFVNGKAALDPIRGSATCRSCRLHALCHIHESSFICDEDEELELTDE